MENTQLLDSVVNIYCDQSRNHSQACFETAKSVLFKLRHCLQHHEHYKRIGCQIEYENTNQLYKMSSRPRGHCLIINNREFYKDPEIQGAIELTSRPGTNLDRDKLLVLFGGLEFIVTCRNNLTDSQILRQLNVTADLPHDDCNMFVCCIMSHGAEGRVYGANGVTVTISSLTRPFTAQLCPSLAGKPKLFFLQACQGVMRQQGCEIEEDAAPEVVRPRSIPNEADFLLGYCTAPGYKAYRNSRDGSWYIPELCEVLGNHYDHLDMLEILTNVNKRVSQKIECDGEDVFHQIPAPMYTLRKKLVLGK
ncbi:caspase-3-like [Littorina saxatilis]|uniref:caspase-3-like n=1 Tax=Littorina saxatilis TaxID=31220 RepID=UPI0038B69DEC